MRTGENGSLRKNLHQFSGWTAAAIYDRYLADGNRDVAVAQLDALLSDFAAWSSERRTGKRSLLAARRLSTGMEESASREMPQCKKHPPQHQ